MPIWECCIQRTFRIVQQNYPWLVNCNGCEEIGEIGQSAMEMEMQGEVEWTHGQELEEGHTHSKSTRTMTQKYNQKATCNRGGLKRVYNRRPNEAVMISGGGKLLRRDMAG